ncbi:endonuclease/exonuclease/phosphatase family protein [uncultured Phenylobacterium sp.]|uniref:endonuclease/exonuclease/phosphatase family protein n=1 Tax=uncultured Phenylobacterium sp. TaxID=349273 RepID=UPI0025D8C1DB|nr:endonuclease/exonuclease/phosphatase family protein [uncultured Phenylobacterium sp.]
MSRFVGWVNSILTLFVLAAAAAALLALGGPRSSWLDVLSHFAPLYGAIGLLGAAWAVAAGRGPVVAASVLAVIASGFLMLPEFLRDTGPVAVAGSPGELKVIQINAGRNNTDIGRVAAWLNAQDADVITVTEARHDLRDLLVQGGWKTAGAAGSLMIFTRERYLRMVRPELRSDSKLTFVNATYEMATRPVEVLTTHIDWPTRRLARKQMEALEEVVAARSDARMIVTGDLNSTPWSAQLRTLDTSLGLIRRDRAVATWPAQVMGRAWPLPFLPIDHVYAGTGWATVKVERGPWVGSDHYPLIVTLAPVAPP